MLRTASSRATEEARPGAGTARAQRGTARHGSAHLEHDGPSLPAAGAPTRAPRGSAPAARLHGNVPPAIPKRGLRSHPAPPGASSRVGSVLFRCRRSRRVGRTIYSERRPRQRGSPAPPPPGPAAPARSPERRQERAQLGSFTAETRRTPRTPQPQAGGGWRRALGAAGARTKKRVPGRQTQFSRQWSGNAVFRGCCCLSVPLPARTARGGHRWPLRGWGARPLGRWSGCSLPERQNALPPDGTHGHSLTPV